MSNVRYLFIILWVVMLSVTDARAQVRIGIGLPNVSIGINLPVYPELVRVPNYPVYYAPGIDANYFFYDGMYWVYQDDTWYASSWYNGPWGAVDPYYVPLYILRVPVRYYRQPPLYFRGWASTRPPHWEQHWGRDWEQRRSGWNRWSRNAAPAPAPLPVYQRQYTGERYPQIEQQQRLRSQHYNYEPRNKVVRQHLQQAAPDRRTDSPGVAPRPPERSPVVQPPHARPAAPPHQQQQPAPRVAPPPQVRPAVPHKEQQQPVPAQQRQLNQDRQDRGQSRQPDQRRGQDNDEDRGRGHR